MSNYIAIESQAADWISRRDSGHWTDEEQQVFDAWLNESPLHRVAYLRLNAAWQRADRLRAIRPSEPVAVPVDALKGVPSSKRQRSAVDWRFRVAAAVAALGFSFLLSGDPNKFVVPHVYSTALGAREAVALEDGSKLTLNTATKLATRVDGTERTVWLQEGEAFFDVAHDKRRPFVIIAGNRRVTVVGTKFSLRRDGDRLNVAVVEGRVQVQVGNTPPTLLARGESAVGEGASMLVTRRTERQSAAATSWLEGRLVFDQMTISEAATEFNRYNRKKLVVADTNAGGIRIGGTFDARNVEAFAKLLQEGFGLTLNTARDDRIVISTGNQ